MQQAIIWINDGLFYWRIYASPVNNELTKIMDFNQIFKFAVALVLRYLISNYVIRSVNWCGIVDNHRAFNEDTFIFFS